jgi:SAM-dependent methyltransferase
MKSNIVCYFVPDPLSIKKQEKYAAMCRGSDVLELGAVNDRFATLCDAAGVKSVTSIDMYPLSKRVIKYDILKYFKDTKKKFDVVYARHLLEHFTPENVVSIIKGAYKVLRPKGRFIIVIPNMNNIAIATTEFWREFEHKRPYTSSGMAQNLTSCGFKVTAVEQDKDSWDMAWYKQAVRKLRSLIVGIPYESPDVYIIGEKEKD